jgi:hypothetical protein
VDRPVEADAQITPIVLCASHGSTSLSSVRI